MIKQKQNQEAVIWVQTKTARFKPAQKAFTNLSSDNWHNMNRSVANLHEHCRQKCVMDYVNFVFYFPFQWKVKEIFQYYVTRQFIPTRENNGNNKAYKKGYYWIDIFIREAWNNKGEKFLCFILWKCFFFFCIYICVRDFILNWTKDLWVWSFYLSRSGKLRGL